MLIEALEQFSLFRMSFEIILPLRTDPIRSVPVGTACRIENTDNAKQFIANYEWPSYKNNVRLVRILGFTSIKIAKISTKTFPNH